SLRGGMSQPLPFQPKFQTGGGYGATALRDAPARREGKSADPPNSSAASSDRAGGRLRRPEPPDLRLSARDRRNTWSLSCRADLGLTDSTRQMKFRKKRTANRKRFQSWRVRTP